MVLAPHPNPDAPVISHFLLTGKTALVTGGSRGIGLSVACGLAEAGASVAITYSTTEPAQALAAIKAAAARAAPSASSPASPQAVFKAYQCNVTDPDAIEAVVQAAAADLSTGGSGSSPRLDILVANAGIAEHIAAIDYPPDRFRNIFDVNVNGALWAAQAAARVFRKQVDAGGRPGSVVFTASVSATLVNIPQQQAAYNASKAALAHLSKSLAVEWVDFARVNCVSPGFIDTDMLSVHPEEWRKQWFQMIPGRRLCKVAELKGIYVFLASDASSYMTGADLIIDGGYTLP